MKPLLIASLLFSPPALAGPPIVWGVSGGSSAAKVLASQICFSDSTCMSTGSTSVSFTTAGSSPNDNGGSISSGVITLQPADATHPGLVSTTTQSFAGNKTIVGSGTVLTIQGSGTGQVLLGQNLSNSSYSAISLNQNANNYNFTSSGSDANLYVNRPAGKDIIIQEGGGSAQTTFNSGGNLTMTGAIIGDGGDALYGFLHSQVSATTTTATIAQCGKTFVNSGSAHVLTLPEASTALGCRYTFVCGDSNDFDVNPNDGTDTILSISTTNGTTAVVTLAPSAGDAIRCTDTGGSISLEAVGTDAWAQVAGGNGIWTDVN